MKITAKRMLSYFPIEFYVLFVPSTLVSAFLWIFLTHETWIKVNNYHLLTILKTMFFNGSVLGNTFLYIFLYIAIKYLVSTLPIGETKRLGAADYKKQFFGKHQLANFLRAGYWLFFTSMYLSMGVLLIGISSRFIPAAYIAHISENLLRTDYALFGSFPAYAVQKTGYITWLAVPSILAYVYTPYLLGIVGFIALFVDKELFRKFFLMIALSLIIAFPFWMIFPAVTPNEMYRHNMFNRTFDERTSNLIGSTSIAPLVTENVDQIEKIWIDPNTDAETRSITVTTMPSMHVIWGLQIAIFTSLIFRRLKYLAITFFLYNALGTLLLLQHFAIDLVIGIGIGVLSYYLSMWLLRFEKKYFIDKLKLVHALGVFERDAAVFRTYITFKK